MSFFLKADNLSVVLSLVTLPLSSSALVLNMYIPREDKKGRKSVPKTSTLQWYIFWPGGLYKMKKGKNFKKDFVKTWKGKK